MAKASAISKREIPGVDATLREPLQERSNEWLFRSKSREKRQISVLRHARLAPTLHGDSPDEAKKPALFLAEGLKPGRRSVNSVHERDSISRRNNCCCSTNPEFLQRSSDIGKGPSEKKTEPSNL